MNAKYLKTKPGKIYRAPLLFLLLASTFLCSLPNQLHGWNSAWYAMDYSLGVDSRLFVGSFLRLFYPDFLPASSAYAFNVLSTLVLLALLSHVLASVLRLVENTPCETGLLALTTLWLLSPGSPAYLWNTENMGRFDLYLFLVTLIAAAVFLHVRAVSVRFAVFTICGMVCLAIHQGYLFTFFPLLAAMYLLTAENRKQLIAAFSCMAVLGVVFLYFQFFSHIRPGSYEELASVLAARTDLPLNESALRFEYFSGFADSARELVTNQLGERIRYGIVTLLLLSPLALLYGWFWQKILRKPAALEDMDAPGGKTCLFGGKTLFTRHLPILSSLLLFLPAFVLTIDWGRWFGAFLTVQFLQVIFLAAKKDAAACSVLASLSTAVRRHPFPFLCAGIWLGSLQKFQATLLPDAPAFFASAYRLFHMLFR